MYEKIALVLHTLLKHWKVRKLIFKFKHLIIKKIKFDNKNIIAKIVV